MEYSSRVMIFDVLLYRTYEEIVDRLLGHEPDTGYRHPAPKGWSLVGISRKRGKETEPLGGVHA
jgi:hypothetical protein